MSASTSRFCPAGLVKQQRPIKNEFEILNWIINNPVNFIMPTLMSKMKVLDELERACTYTKRTSLCCALWESPDPVAQRLGCHVCTPWGGAVPN